MPVASAPTGANEAPAAQIAAAGLLYTTDDAPGIRRRRSGQGFDYLGPGQGRIRDPATLARIRALAIPPAWTDVWICPDPNGHIQAMGRDARGRKQYRYHPRWRELRDEDKFERMLAFAERLPAVRARVQEHLALRGTPREKVLATIVTLLERTLIRVGNREYERENGSYGLTTLRDRHVDADGAELCFQFRGKRGKTWRVRVEDRRISRIIRSLQDLPGQRLFQYTDSDGEVRTVTSTDVNDYLREISGSDITAKDFRTWAGTVLAAMALHEFEAFASKAKAQRNIRAAIEQVATRLGNTPTICRKCYVHPEILNCYLDGSLVEIVRKKVEQELREDLAGLSPEEAAVLALLQRRLAGEPTRAAPQRRNGRGRRRPERGRRDRNRDPSRALH